MAPPEQYFSGQLEKRIKQLEEHRKILGVGLVAMTVVALAAAGWSVQFVKPSPGPSPASICTPYPGSGFCESPLLVTWNVNNSLYLNYWGWTNVTRTLTIFVNQIQKTGVISQVESEQIFGWSCTPFPYPQNAPLGCQTATNRAYATTDETPLLLLNLTMTAGHARLYSKTFTIWLQSSAPCDGTVNQTVNSGYAGITFIEHVPELCVKPTI